MSRLVTCLLLALSLFPKLGRGDDPPPTPAPAPVGCAIYSIEGIQLGMTAAEALAACPTLSPNASAALSDEGDHADGTPSRNLFVKLENGRVWNLMRAYVGMSQAGVRDKFIERFGQPTLEGGRPLQAGVLTDFARSHTFVWKSADCSVSIELHLDGEEDWHEARPPGAIVTMQEIPIPAAPPRGPADVKF